MDDRIESRASAAQNAPPDPLERLASLDSPTSDIHQMLQEIERGRAQTAWLFNHETITLQTPDG